MIDEINENLYTVQELEKSNRLRISKTTIWREINEGKLSFYKIRGQIFVGEQHIREYLGQCETRRTDNSKFLDNSIFSFGMM